MAFIGGTSGLLLLSAALLSLPGTSALATSQSRGIVTQLKDNVLTPFARVASNITVEGYIDVATPQVAQFLGIPYAQPPTGALRWALPQPANLNGRIVADKPPPSCFQFVSSSPGIYTTIAPEFQVPGSNNAPMSEDCLTTSIWAPVASLGGPVGYPVLVFFHGGAFKAGSETVPYQLPTSWIQRTQNLVVVSFNYRLNVFGFPNADGLSEQNLGLRDQRLAVEWIRDNIGSFGGDANRITIWGQSAGAASVDLYALSYPSDVIARGMILDSGSALLDINSKDTNHSNFAYLASGLGCNSTVAATRLSCMRQVNASRITNFLRDQASRNSTMNLNFAPIADEKVVFSNVSARELAGGYATIPAIIGQNTEDGVAFVSYSENGVNTAQATDQYKQKMLCPAIKTTQNRLATDRRTYRYLYAGNFSNISPKPWMGAYHSAELPLIFGTHGDFRGRSTPFETQVSTAMQDAWYAFAADPWLGPESTGWQAVTSEVEFVRVFGEGNQPAKTTIGTPLDGQCS